MQEQDIVPQSWAELLDRLYEESWNERLGRFRSNFAYRGMQDSRFDLTTTLVRLGGDYPRHEEDLLRNFRKYAHKQAAMGDSLWYWLSLAQHHGLPTRLLDWTYSPFVALHFATAEIELFDTDGLIWCVDYIKTRQLMPRKLRDILEQEDTNIFTAEMLSQAARSLREFDDLSRDDYVVFIEPPSLDERIVNQYALFSLMSSPSANLENWLREHPECHRRVIIPASLKWEIRDKLDQANITERVLFPGLDGLSSWLRRYYSPHAPDNER
ncbi:MAG TPA: FRG domain-containing protein [Chloroflexia bacterium]